MGLVTMNVRLAFATSCLLAAACWPFSKAAIAEQTMPVPELNWGACKTAPAPFQCATAQVPKDYGSAAGDMITLAVIRYPAANPTNKIGTLFFNPGGPGGQGTTDLPAFISQFSDVARSRFDIVSWDPRGVGPVQPYSAFPTKQPKPLFSRG
jgi:pimeloyl-ACP methyl ester carboxylesterase